jgi:serine/threonine-protein kinase RsbT
MAAMTVADAGRRNVAGLEDRLLRTLESCMDRPSAQGTLRLCVSMARVDVQAMRARDGERLLKCLQHSLEAVVRDPRRRGACADGLAQVLASRDVTPDDGPRRAEVAISEEYDIVQARAVGRDVATDLGFSPTAQVKIATVISELARNIFAYAGAGTIAITGLDDGRPGIEIVASDQGPGVADVDLVLSGDYESRTGLGIGLRGSKKLMDEFAIESVPGKGTTVRARKYRE